MGVKKNYLEQNNDIYIHMNLLFHICNTYKLALLMFSNCAARNQGLKEAQCYQAEQDCIRFKPIFGLFPR